MLKSLCGAALIAVLSLMVLAGCGCGAGGSGATEAGTIPGTPPEEQALPPAPQKLTHHRGRILAGEVRTLPDSSGEGAWAAGRSIYLTPDDGRTWRAAAPVDVHGFVGSDFVDPEHGWVVASTNERHAHLAIYATTDGGFTWTKGEVQRSRQCRSSAPRSPSRTCARATWWSTPSTDPASKPKAAFTAPLTVARRGARSARRRSTAGSNSPAPGAAGWRADCRARSGTPPTAAATGRRCRCPLREATITPSDTGCRPGWPAASKYCRCCSRATRPGSGSTSVRRGAGASPTSKPWSAP